jgi:uncharacterized protein (DUF433 family)
MSLIVDVQTVPLKADPNGVMRVGDTRVTLDTVVHAFEEGHTAEEIVSHYPALRLADVYAVIAYYLNNQGVPPKSCTTSSCVYCDSLGRPYAPRQATGRN